MSVVLPKASSAEGSSTSDAGLLLPSASPGAVCPSTILRLPNELLQIIFVEAHIQTVALRWSVPVVSMVCRRWRCVAHGTPALWTKILVCFLRTAPRPSERKTPGLKDVAELEVWLHRAKKQPVQLYLRPSLWEPDKEEKEAQEVVDLLSQHSTKIQSLSVLFSTVRGIVAFGQQCKEIQARFPSLKTLSLNIDTQYRKSLRHFVPGTSRHVQINLFQAGPPSLFVTWAKSVVRGCGRWSMG